MRFKVTVQPGGQTFPVEDEQTVLDAALAAGIVLPYSCRSGTCSTCRGKVCAGTFEAGSAPERILGAADVAAGYTLLCQARPRSDLVIEAEEVQLASDVVVRKMPVRVMGLQPLAPDVMEVTLQLPASQPFRFHPGQYLEFILEGGHTRSYSMACAQVVDRQVQLHVRHMPGGRFTDAVFGRGTTPLSPRAILRIEGPLGSFFVRDDASHPIVFLASGTGFAPIKAMVEDLIRRGNARPVVLYWGGRRPQDLYHQALATAWERQHPDFRFIPVVSDAQAGDDWSGRTGWVHRAVMADFPDLSAHQVYACGSPAMVEAARHDFIAHCGLPREAFFADAFTSEADRVGDEVDAALSGGAGA